jgi:two-component system NarL family sensor kinase
MTSGPGSVTMGSVKVESASSTRLLARLATAGRPAVVALALGAAALLSAAAAFLSAAGTADDGAAVPLERSAFLPDGLRVVVADDRATLRDGDVVMAIAGKPVSAVVSSLFSGGVVHEPGARAAYVVERDGALNQLAVPVVRRDLGAGVSRDWGGAVLVPSLALMGALLLSRRPDVPAVRVLFVFGSFAVLSWSLSVSGPSPLDVAAGRWWFVGGGLATLLSEAALLHFVLVFPSAPDAFVRRPRLAALAYAVPFALHAADATLSTFAGASAAEVMGAWAVPRVEPVVAAAILVVPIVRLRRTNDPLARRQLRLIGGQLVVSGLFFIGLFALPSAVGAHPVLPSSWAAVPFWSFPVVLAVAVLRFDLFEIRVLVHRSLLYTVLTVSVVASYAAVVGLLSAATGRRAGFAASAAAAGLVAVAFHPLRHRLQRAVGRLVYGGAAEPYEVLAQLGRRLEDLAQPDAVLDAVVETVARSLGRPYVAIELTDGDHHEVAAFHGTPTNDTLAVSLVHQTAEVGRLVVGLRQPGEQVGPAEQRLIADLAAHVGTVLVATRLAVDVQRSRERLVSALEEERRRVGRDLHDGLGPRLAAAAMKLEAAGRMARRDLDAALALHDEVRRELGDVIGDVRRLVYALRPPALDQLGLVGALREQANRLAARSNGGRAVDFEVSLDGPLPELPAAVEVAAYRIASEAMTNAARHADATRVVVRLGASEALTVEVEDDGRGMPGAVGGGVGVASMRERAEELGGAVSIEAGASGGTVVTASLPLEGT